MFDKVLEIDKRLSKISFRIRGLGNCLGDMEMGFKLCWVLTDIEISNKYFTYGGKEWEILMVTNLISLRDCMVELMDGTMTEVNTLNCMEPDLSFRFIPTYEQRRDGDKTWQERINICEMTILLHYGGLEYTDEKYVIPFYDEEMKTIVDYLNEMIPLLQAQWDAVEKFNYEDEE